MYNLFEESTLMYAFASVSLCGFLLYANDKLDDIKISAFENYVYAKTNLESIRSTYVLPILKTIGFGKEDSLIIIKDGKEILKMKTEDFESIKYGNSDNIDMIFRSVPNDDVNDEQEYDVKIYNKLSDINEDVVISNISFLSPKIEIRFKENDEDYQRCFELDNLFTYNNLYVENNELFSYKFIEYIMMKNNKFVLKPEDDITISFIDQNMDYIELCERESVLIEKDDYIIKNDEYFENEKKKEKKKEETECEHMAEEDELSKDVNEVNESIFNYLIF